MHIGVDYYPEHWPRERWKTDAQLMKQASFDVVRLAEFDWVGIEPRDGEFDFELWDAALAVLAEHGISAIMCTPTAVMPAWVAAKHPETLAMQRDGTRIVWGVRKENCFSSGAYRFLSRRVTRAMAEHFRDVPNVIGWQTDNEFGAPACYCESCRISFQHWLRDRYGSLAELNRAWGTHFWGHRVQRWDEITIPVDRSTYNPGACLDWQRHRSWLNVRFQREQVEILRELCPSHFVTHNLMGVYPELDYYELARDLDFVSWDNYPMGGAPGVRWWASMGADLMRGVKGRNFWIMEQTAGAGGWGTFGRNPRPGEIRSIAYQQLGRGADGQVWFRWRTCTAGREQYWHGLLGHDGRALRRYQEAAQTAREYRLLEKALAGTTVKAEVAIVYDYQSLWATRIQPGFVRNDYTGAIGRYYEALFRAGINVDMIPTDCDLSKYKLVLAPRLYVMPDALAGRLADYVRGGGVLLADCRTGVKDETGLCHERTLPGLLAECLGIEIPEYEALSDDMEYPLVGAGRIGGRFTAIHYADWTVARGAEAIASFEQWHLASCAGVTRNAFGKGAAWYVGTVVKEPAFYDVLIAEILEDAGVSAEIAPPAGVEVSVRTGEGAKIYFLINHTEEEREVALPREMTDLLAAAPAGRSVRLPRHGVAVLR